MAVAAMTPAQIKLWVVWFGDHFWWLIGGGVAFALGLWILGAVLHRQKGSHSQGWGSARWATYREMQRAGLFAGEGIILGRFGREILRASGETHVLLIGPTRAGKGVSTIIPSLLTWPHSVLCLDIKGDDYDLTAGYRQTLGPVYRVQPTSRTSHRLNVIDFMRVRTIQEVGDAQRLAQSLASPTAPPSQATDYWRGQAEDLLTMLLLYLCYQDKYPRSLGGLLALMNDPETPLLDLLKRIKSCQHPIVQQGLQRLNTMPPSKRAEVWDSAMRLLTIWRDPLVDRATSATDVPLDALQHGDQPSSLYLQVTAEDLRGRLRPLFRVWIEQLMSRLTDRAVRDFRHPLLLVLDEFAAMGYLPAIENAVSLLAGYGIRVLVVLQSLNQLLDAYGENTGIVDNCSTRIIYAPNNPVSAATFAELLGAATVQESSMRWAGSRFMPVYEQHAATTQSHARPLLTAAEIMELGASEAIVRSSACPPIRCTKIRFYEDPLFRRRVLPVAP
jgi:type IV secretion system protein VirD4